MSEEAPEFFYREGMKYDLNQDRSPSAATSARAAFQQASMLGHLKATRALAHLIYEGRGGAMDQEHALMLLWSCFLKGDHGSLQELEDMLESYAEQNPPPSSARTASFAAQNVKKMIPAVEYVHGFMLSLQHAQARRSSK